MNDEDKNVNNIEEENVEELNLIDDKEGNPQDTPEQDQDGEEILEENASPRENLENAIIGEDDNRQDLPFNE